MTKPGLPVTVAIVLMAILGVGRAGAQPPPSRFEASGTFLTGGSPIDTNNDRVTADLYVLSGSSTQLGSLTNQAIVEWTYGPPTIACPLGTALEGTLLPAGSAVVTRAANGDLLFGRFISGTSCVDATGTASISAAGTFTGGTGVFAGATGAFTATATATILVADPGRAFGAVVVTVEGTLTPP